MHTVSTAFVHEQDEEESLDELDRDVNLDPASAQQLEEEGSASGGAASLSASRASLARHSHRLHLSAKVRELFHLPESEEVAKCHPCWLFRTVLLRGYAYLTTSYLCFYAYLPSAKHGRPSRAGPLLKRTRRTLRFSRHHAILRENALSWYESDKDPYFPQGHIDLRTVTDVSAVVPAPAASGAVVVEKEKEKEKEAVQFTVETPDRTYLFCAPSPASRDEWVVSLRKAVFRARNDGNSVRISIPFEAILDVEEASSASLDEPALATALAEQQQQQHHQHGGRATGGNGGSSSALDDLVAVKVIESGHDFALDEFHFLNFGSKRTRFLQDLKAVIADVAAQEIGGEGGAGGQGAVDIPAARAGGGGEAQGQSALSTTPTALSQSQATYPPRRVAQVPPSGASRAVGILSAMPGWVARGSEGAGRLLMQAPRVGSALISTLGEAERRARSVREIWRAGPTPVTETSSAEAPAEEKSQEELFRWTFPTARGDQLLETAPCSLYRVLPTKGLLFLSDKHICFRSSGLATRTMGRTLMLLPLSDVISVAKHHAFQPGQHGLVIVIRGHEEIFLEFPAEEKRDEASKVIESILEQALAPGDRGVSAERADFLVLRDLNEKLEAGPRRTTSSSSDEETSSDLSKSISSGSALLAGKPDAPLRITMLTIGSRGDVQPYIALGKTLMADGHKIRIATHAEFRPWVEGHGIEFSPVGGDPAELMRICVENGTFTVAFVRESMLKFRGWLDDLLLSCWQACQGSDLIIESPSAIAGIHVAEALQVPYFRAFTMPWTRTRAYPHAFAVPGSKAGGNYNYIVSGQPSCREAIANALPFHQSYVIFDQVFWRASAGQINRWRQQHLQLKPTNYDLLEQHKAPFLYNFSPHLVPKPLVSRSRRHIGRKWRFRPRLTNLTHITGLVRVDSRHWLLVSGQSGRRTRAELVSAACARKLYRPGKAGREEARLHRLGLDRRAERRGDGCVRSRCGQPRGRSRDRQQGLVRPAGQEGRQEEQASAGRRERDERTAQLGGDLPRGFGSARLAFPAARCGVPPRRRRHTWSFAPRGPADHRQAVLWRPVLLGPAGRVARRRPVRAEQQLHCYEEGRQQRDGRAARDGAAQRDARRKDRRARQALGGEDPCGARRPEGRRGHLPRARLCTEPRQDQHQARRRLGCGCGCWR